MVMRLLLIRKAPDNSHISRGNSHTWPNACQKLPDYDGKGANSLPIFPAFLSLQLASNAGLGFVITIDSRPLIFLYRGSTFLYSTLLVSLLDILSRRMAAHLIPRGHALRQINNAPIPPTVSGLTDTAITQTATAPDSAPLSYDSSSHSNPTAPQLATATPAITASQLSTTQPSAVPSSTASAASNASSSIPMSTVIGSCVGALIGAVALILLGVWFYRRYSKSLKERARSRGPIAHTRNTHADLARRRSRAEPWSKLEDGDDKWEGMYQAKEVDTVAPMEKLTMFKKSPSVRTAYTHKSEEPIPFDPHGFAQYHPNLAEELASDKVTGMPVPRPFLGRVDPSNPISWDGETLGNSSLNSVLSLRSNRMEGGAMSPSLSMAIPTPPATSSEPHRWQSAEVVDLVGQSAEVFGDDDPFGESSQRRKSFNNPFFKAQDASTKSPTRPLYGSTTTLASTSKGKERSVNSNPFSDDNEMSFPQPFTQHGAKDSLGSVTSTDRALANLIAALEIPEEEVQERLRVASMQPSFISNTSVYTSGGEEEDVTQAFPLPPLTDGNHIYKQ